MTNPTAEQGQFAEHAAEAFLEACPGAGKTLAILERVRRIGRALPPRRGVAVLSFTNKAIEELRNRSATEGVDHLLRHPGFLGTVDAFVRHFLFAPFGVDGVAEAPHVVDSWDTLDAKVRLRGGGGGGAGVSLDAFDSIANTVNFRRIDNRQRNAVQQHQRQYELAAAARRRNLHQQGYFSAQDARAITLQRLRGQFGDSLGRAIAARFAEVIVDEAQDCNPEDLEVLAWLRRHGVRVMMVCDLDQSIFEFRDGARANIEAFAATYPAGDRLRLTGNFRSSPPICALSASLRRAPQADDAVGEHHLLDERICLRPYGGRAPTADIGAWFARHADERGLRRDGLMVLAHTDRAARLAAGGSTAGTGQSKIERWARAVGEFWSETTHHGKARALGALEKLLLEIEGRLQEGESVQRAVRRLGINPRELRRRALECLMRVARACADTDADRLGWVESARAVLVSLRIVLPAGVTLPRALPNPGSQDWSRHLGQPAAADGQLRFSTIHNAKGGQYDGVCVVIPPDGRTPRARELFDAWAGRTDHESKRVIYVGATRAQRVLVLAIPEALLDECVAILTAANVPHVVHR